MLEIIENMQNEAIVAITLAIVGLIKDKGFLAKVNTKLISIVISAILVVLIKVVMLSETTLLVIENISLLLLPALGYDYLINPIIKPLLKKLRRNGITS